MERSDLINIYQEAVRRNIIIENHNRKFKSLKEICELCGYPKPYPEQEKFFEFVLQDGVLELLGCRGVGKTVFTTIIASVYLIYNYDQSVIIFTQGRDRALQLCKEISFCLGKLGIKKVKDTGQSIRTNTKTGKEDSLFATTINSTSKRGQHPDKIFMDDPQTVDNISARDMERIHNNYQEILALCKNIVVIGQPIRSLDLYDTLRSKVKTYEVPWGRIPELDHDLDALRAAGMPEAKIAANYFLDISQDVTMPFQLIKHITDYPNQESVAFLDPSIKTGGDYTAITCATEWFAGMAFVGDMWQKSWDKCCDEILGLCISYRVKILIVETNVAGDVATTMLSDLLRPHGIKVVGRHTKTNKLARIMAAGAKAEKLFASKLSSPLYLGNIENFQDGVKHDDAPDSLASLLEYLNIITIKDDLWG